MLRGLVDSVCRLITKTQIRRKHISVASSVTINGLCKFLSDSPGSIKIGDVSSINSGRRFNPIGGDTYSLLRTIGNGKIFIGSNVGISNSTIVARESVAIEDNVRIGGSCKIYDNDFHSINIEKRISENDDDIKTAPVLIKNGAFVGAHSIILKGVTIGEKSVIGAGSVVTKNVPDGEIWVGNPARFVKKL